MKSSAMIEERYSVISARWDIMAPFGVDVVPEV